MDITAKVGQLVRVPFALYEADGISRMPGQADAVDVELWRDDRAGARTLVFAQAAGDPPDPNVVDVLIAETARHDYVALFTPGAPGDYDLVVRHTASRAELEARAQAYTVDADDLAARIDRGSSFTGLPK